MQNEELVILQPDRQYAIDRIEELKKEIQDLGPEFYDVFNQSSETWHDNAPFDALRDRQSVLDSELQNLKGILRNSTIVLPKQNKSAAGVGCYITLGDINGKKTKYFVAGDWTPFAGSKKNGAIIVSRVAPIAKMFAGRRAGYKFEFRGKVFELLSIDYDIER